MWNLPWSHIASSGSRLDHEARFFSTENPQNTGHHWLLWCQSRQDVLPAPEAVKANSHVFKTRWKNRISRDMVQGRRTSHYRQLRYPYVAPSFFHLSVHRVLTSWKKIIGLALGHREIRGGKEKKWFPDQNCKGFLSLPIIGTAWAMCSLLGQELSSVGCKSWMAFSASEVEIMSVFLQGSCTINSQQFGVLNMT